MSQPYETAKQPAQPKKGAQSQKANAEKGSSSALLLVSVIVLIIGIAAEFSLTSFMPQVSATIAFFVFIGCLVLSGLIAIVSPQGKAFIKFSKESYREIKKVVWPTKDETVKTTLLVIVFAFVMSLILWLADIIISWVLYVQILG